MGSIVLAVATYIRAIFVRRHKLALEAAALRQQLSVCVSDCPPVLAFRL